MEQKRSNEVFPIDAQALDRLVLEYCKANELQLQEFATKVNDALKATKGKKDGISTSRISGLRKRGGQKTSKAIVDAIAEVLGVPFHSLVNLSEVVSAKGGCVASANASIDPALATIQLRIEPKDDNNSIQKDRRQLLAFSVSVGFGQTLAQWTNHDTGFTVRGAVAIQQCAMITNFGNAGLCVGTEVVGESREYQSGGLECSYMGTFDQPPKLYWQIKSSTGWTNLKGRINLPSVCVLDGEYNEQDGFNLTVKPEYLDAVPFETASGREYFDAKAGLIRSVLNDAISETDELSYTIAASKMKFDHEI